MAVNTGQYVELGAELKAARAATGLTVRGLAGNVGINQALISLWENGHRLPRLEQLEALVDHLQVVGDDRERIIGLRHELEGGPGELDAGSPNIGALLAKLIEHERNASRIVHVAPLMLPGLLQTSDYSRAILAGTTDIETKVALRVGRRDVLNRKPMPVDYTALIYSEVLVQPMASPDVMRDQLLHLLKMAEMPNVTIQVVSSMRCGWNPLHSGPFILFEFPSARPIVHLEHLRSSVFLWHKEDVRAYMSAVEEIQNAAMTPAESVEVIAELVDGMETT